MDDIVFTVTTNEDGTLTASWDDPCGGGITTQGTDVSHLQEMISDAVHCHFDDDAIPNRARLHFVSDPTLAFA